MKFGKYEIKEKWEILYKDTYMKDVRLVPDKPYDPSDPIPDYAIYIICSNPGDSKQSVWWIYYPEFDAVFNKMHLILFKSRGFKSGETAKQAVDLVLDKLCKLKSFL